MAKTTQTTTIYHNPRCSKSRAVLALLAESGAALEVVEYLKTPPDAVTLGRIVTMLGGSVADIMRAGEAVYRELGLAGRVRSVAEGCEIIAAQPILLQ